METKLNTQNALTENKIVQKQPELFSDAYITLEQSKGLSGQAELVGAKNAVLVSMVALVLTNGKSVLTNVPNSDDVLQMISLLEELGAKVSFNGQENILCVDTSTINRYKVSPEIMKRMRASVLVMGPLLARFSRAEIAVPGGDLIGTRPIDFHLKNFEKMGATIEVDGEFVTAKTDKLRSANLVLDYPSVGATENLLMAATLTKGTTRIVNAALEPEVIDLITLLRKMGAQIAIYPPAILEIQGVERLNAVDHEIMFDRIEAGSLLLACAITGGELYLPQADASLMDVFLLKLQEMGHSVETGPEGKGIKFKATTTPRAVSFITSPYPGFPTDLQAPMMAAQCLARGTSMVHETVYESRFLHVRELQKMGAQIKVEGDKAVIIGVDELYGTQVIASDIRGACSLVLAGLAASGKTTMTGVYHWKRGYQALDQKLMRLGAKISLKTT